MIRRKWGRAFREGNRSMAIKVAQFLRDDFGWDVNFDDDMNCISIVESSYGTFDCSDQDEFCDMTDPELLHQFASDVGLNASRLQRLDNKFGTEYTSLGKYTKLPLPKDIKKESNNGDNVQAV